MSPFSGAIIPLLLIVPSRTSFTALVHYVSIWKNAVWRMHLPTAHGVPTNRLMALGPEDPNGLPYSESVEVLVSLVPSLFSISNLCWRSLRRPG